MKRAETSFCSIADHCVLSHLHHAKKLVPFKTFTSTVDKTSSFSSDFFGGIAFGSNVFLRCHTDADFTMSITQAFLKGIPEYHLKDDVIAYFCFPTLGVAVPLPPGDYFMFNALIPHCRHLVPSMMPFLIAPLGKSRSLCLLTNMYTCICNLSTSSLKSFVSTSNNNVLSSLMQGTEMLVVVCGSYDDLSGLCPSSSKLSSLLLYFAGHDAI